MTPTPALTISLNFGEIVLIVAVILIALFVKALHMEVIRAVLRESSPKETENKEEDVR